MFTADDSLERFIALAKIAKLKQRLANQRRYPNAPMEPIAEAETARERATAYTVECIAQELYKRQPAVFCPDVQTRFSTVGHIVNRHIQPGDRGINQRRALIERAETFASFSLFHDGHDETDDYQAIANRLNSDSLFAFQRNREIGGRGPGATLATIPFTHDQAREMINEFGHLQQVIRTRLRTIDRVFSDGSHDHIEGYQIERIERQLSSVSLQLESKPADPTLARIDAEARERKESVESAFSDDPFFE
ncbi:hypothetical protein [Rhizobium leguminosarum]|uniref:hypothetical protein n=1 Tax=Rhizobium leguminosarum TaxID=384 RepID=UPI001C98B5F3|nr:hypothetical protein [Rhizobium leguminosarum]MBY5701104.1 hypothetical protein [Rhizobium leguminosarum]